MLHFYNESSQLCCLAALQTQLRCIFEPNNTVTWAPFVTFRKIRYLGFSHLSSWRSCVWASGSLNLSPKGPTAGTNSRSCGKKIARILRNPKFRSVFTRARPFTLSSATWIHSTPSDYLLTINLNIILSPTLSSSNCSLLYPSYQIFTPHSLSEVLTSHYLLARPAQSALVTLRQYKSRTS
jgi:hypothetical protein